MQYADNAPSDQVDYVDDAQIYEDDHGEEHSGGSYDYDMTKDYGKEDKDYYEYQGESSDHRREGGGSMW